MSKRAEAEKSVLARRQNQHAGRVRYPDEELPIDLGGAAGGRKRVFPKVCWVTRTMNRAPDGSGARFVIEDW